MNNSLSKSVAALPEVYQPIFGHPEFSGGISRTCGDRLEQITKIYKMLQMYLGRPLRVLDLGCAQGYLSFSLARLGAVVHGIDYLEENIAVCQVLKDEHPEFKVSFEIARIEKILPKISVDQYDLVLSLSVLHHLVYEIGKNRVQRMLSELAVKISVGIFELALNNEPLYWAFSQPKNIRSLLKGFAFVHEVAEYSTHLSDVARPLYIASNHYWFFNNQIGKFDTWKTDSHRLRRGSHYDTRCYFLGEGLLVKLFGLDNAKHMEINIQEHNNAIKFLSNPPPEFNAPRLLQYGANKHELWLVCECLPGELLLDIIHNKKSYDALRVLRDILEQLVVLENSGFYHNDIRLWNVIVSPDGQANLIDYGAITESKNDSILPGNIFMVFLIFVYEVISGQIKFFNSMHKIIINTHQIKQPYRNWLFAFYSTPKDQWSFKLLQKYFMQINELQKDEKVTENAAKHNWVKAIEQSINTQISFARHLCKQQLRIKIENEIMVARRAMVRTKINESNSLQRQKTFSVIVWPMRKVFGNSYLRTQILGILIKHPKLKCFLHEIAMRLNIVSNRSDYKSYKNDYKE